VHQHSKGTTHVSWKVKQPKRSPTDEWVNLSWVVWHTPAVLVLRKWRQVECEFEASPSYIVRSCLKTPIKWVNNPNMTYLYNGILFSCEKEWSVGTYYNIDEPGYMILGDRSQTQRSHTVWAHLHKMSRIGKTIDTGSRSMLTKTWWERSRQGVTAWWIWDFTVGDETVLE
jgi:hypothetical protein